MKLLFDQNVSPRLVDRLATEFPDSVHVSSIGLATVEDRAVWDFAREGEYVIVSKDADFIEMGLVRGFPPWVVWIGFGNCGTLDIECVLRQRREQIEELVSGGMGLIQLTQRYSG